jgi:hypothetical protein
MTGCDILFDSGDYKQDYNLCSYDITSNRKTKIFNTETSYGMKSIPDKDKIVLYSYWNGDIYFMNSQTYEFSPKISYTNVHNRMVVGNKTNFIFYIDDYYSSNLNFIDYSNLSTRSWELLDFEDNYYPNRGNYLLEINQDETEMIYAIQDSGKYKLRIFNFIDSNYLDIIESDSTRIGSAVFRENNEIYYTEVDTLFAYREIYNLKKYNRETGNVEFIANDFGEIISRSHCGNFIFTSPVTKVINLENYEIKHFADPIGNFLEMRGSLFLTTRARAEVSGEHEYSHIYLNNLENLTSKKVGRGAAACFTDNPNIVIFNELRYVKD